jgi:hypothetical protein
MATKKSTRKAINYDKLAQMWNAGKTYADMGKALGMKGNEKADPFKPVRAAISNMLNGKAAWRDSKGKPKVLAPREGMHNFGVGKQMHKKAKGSKKVVAINKKTTSKKVVVPKIDGKTLAAGGGK